MGERVWKKGKESMCEWVKSICEWERMCESVCVCLCVLLRVRVWKCVWLRPPLIFRLRESSEFDTILRHYLRVRVCCSYVLMRACVFACLCAFVCVCVCACVSEIMIVSFENEIFYEIKENRLRPWIRPCWSDREGFLSQVYLLFVDLLDVNLYCLCVVLKALIFL